MLQLPAPPVQHDSDRFQRVESTRIATNAGNKTPVRVQLQNSSIATRVWRLIQEDVTRYRHLGVPNALSALSAAESNGPVRVGIVATH